MYSTIVELAARHLRCNSAGTTWVRMVQWVSECAQVCVCIYLKLQCKRKQDRQECDTFMCSDLYVPQLAQLLDDG